MPDDVETRDALFVREWIRAFSRRIDENKSHLTKLDSAIGDGDHGQNMHRGLQAAVQSISEDDIGGMLRKAAMAVISKTGGASGPLYGTFFMDAGKAAPDGDLTLGDWATMMRAGLEGVQKRGKADTGEKTMVDVLVPAVDALDEAVSGGGSWAEALVSATDAAENGMHATTPLVATKGRASYLGERSKGHQDPGATSTYHLFAAAVDAETNGGS